MSGEGPITHAPRHLAPSGRERVHRRHIALALSVTLLGLPVLALDNLPATAETNQAQGAPSVSDEPTTTLRRIAAPSPQAPTTTVAPTTTEPPAASVPPTTAAPTPTAEPRVPAVAAPPPAPTTTAPPRPAPPPPAPRNGDPNDPATWERLAQCESGGNWVMNAGNGYFGGLQFSLATWQNVGGAGYPHQASKAEQIERGKILQARGGWGQWPGCARDLGYL